MTAKEINFNQTERPARPRRNKRVRVCFPVTVEVPAGGGRTRVQKAHTVIVSHAGATLDMDESIPEGMGVQVMPPFGGTLLAEVNDAWVDGTTGRHRVSIRLIHPVSWTSPERLSALRDEDPEEVTLGLHPRVWQMLAEYTTFLNETDTVAGAALTPAEAVAKILEETFLTDPKFQDWFAEKIFEDLRSWEESSVLVL